jgi:hypothetical protein
MTRHERNIYHQIHPAKLAADAAAGFVAVASFSAGHAALGAAAAVLPPVAASWLVLRHAGLERQRRSRFGAYVNKYMTARAQAQRVAGFAVLLHGAWTHSFLAPVFGAALILHAWAAGLLVPRDIRR